MSAPLSTPHDIQESHEMDKVDDLQAPIKSVGHVQDMSAEDRAFELKRALAADPGVPVRSLRFLQVACTMLIVCMCGGDAGKSPQPVCAHVRFRWYRHVFSQLDDPVPGLLWFR